MPKLNDIQIADRLHNKLEDLRNGKEISARDLRALLTDEQEAMLDASWEEQQELRKKKRARTKEEERELGWLSKREIQIQVVEHAIRDATNNFLKNYEDLQRKYELKQAKKFIESYFNAKDAGKNFSDAITSANNDLIRAGLKRIDRRVIENLSVQENEVLDMEEKLRKLLKSEMTQEEREQAELLEEHEKNLAKRRKKSS